MKCIKIIKTGSYLPKEKIDNKEIEQRLNLNDGYIEKRTGIKQRYYTKDETIGKMAINASKNLIDKTNKKEIEKIGLIITATTSTKSLMPRNFK